MGFRRAHVCVSPIAPGVQQGYIFAQLGHFNYPTDDIKQQTESSSSNFRVKSASMEAAAGAGVTTVIEQDVEEAEYCNITQSMTEVLSEAAEEGCEPNEDHYTSYPGWEEDNGSISDDPGSYGNSCEGGESEYSNDGHDEDEGTAYEYPQEDNEAIEYEEDGEASENVNEGDGATQHPKSSDDYWSNPPSGLAILYEYEEYFLGCPSDVVYALQRHMINEFEASFHRLGHHYFGEDLKSEKWRREILTDQGAGRLPNLPWDKVHAVEVKDWIQFLDRVISARMLPEDALADPKTFSPPNPTPAFVVLGMARSIRNRTFHREQLVTESELMTALRIPRVLKDYKRAEELEKIVEVIVKNPTLDAPSSEWVRHILFPPQPESGTCLEIHAKMLSILEEGSFYFAQWEDRGRRAVLARKSWTAPEHGEMQIYALHWKDTPSEYYNLANATKPEECANLDGQFYLHKHLRKAVMSEATDLRNSVCHRNPLNDPGVCYNLWNTILCFILMGDRVRAIEVESLVEAFLTKTSRINALLRLYNASRDDEPERRLAIDEVCRRENIKADPLDSPKHKSFPVSPQPSSDKGSRWPEISKSAKDKCELTYDEEEELWRSAVHRFVFCDSMHELLMREHPIEGDET